MATTEFETYFVMSVIYSERFRNYVISWVGPEFLNEWGPKTIYEAVQRLHRKERKVSFITVEGELLKDPSISTEKVEELIGYMNMYKSDESTLSSMIDHVLPRIEEEVGINIVTNAILSAQNLLEIGRFKDVFEIFEKAKVSGIFHKPKEKRLFQSIEEGNGNFSIPYTPGIPLGIRGLTKDAVMTSVDSGLYHRGLPRGALAIFGGQSGQGKTPFMQNMALYQALLGYEVDYYSLEVDEDYLYVRSISMLTEIPTNDLHLKEDEVSKKLKEVLSKYPNHKEVAYYQSKAHHLLPSQIAQNLTYSARAGRKVDVVYVDYVDLMACEKRFKEEWQAAAYNTVELRDIGIDHQCGMITASQLDKESSTKKIATRKNVRGAFAKIFTADIFGTINWESTDRTDVYGNKRPLTVINFWLDKTRYSSAYLHLKLEADLACGRLFDPLPSLLELET